MSGTPKVKHTKKNSIVKKNQLKLRENLKGK